MNTYTNNFQLDSTSHTTGINFRTTPKGRMQTIRIQVQCGDPLVCAGLRAALEDSPEFELLPPPPRAGGMNRETVATPPTFDTRADVVVTDYEQGLALIASARTHAQLAPSPRPHVLVVTPRETEWDIRQALEQGVRGYLSLGCELEEVAEAARSLHAGMRHIGQSAARRLADSVACTALTSRETDVLRLVAQGRCNKVVAHELNIAVGTVKSHLKTIFEKLGAKSRTEVAMVAQQRGLLGQYALPTTASLPSMLPTSHVGMRKPAQTQALHMKHHAQPRFGVLMN